MDVPLKQGPITVSTKRLASAMILLDRDPDLESRGLEPEIQATSTGKETNYSWRWHGGTLVETPRGVKT